MKFDFSKREYDFFIENCCFTDDELEILNLRRRGKSIIQVSQIMQMSESAVNRRISSIKKKMLREI